MHLFVYGTLKRGKSRRHFLSGQTYVATAGTRPIYRLYNLGEFPGMVERADGLSIEGELWEVDEACRKRLDQVEGCDTGLYRRVPVKLAPPHHEIAAETYVYQQAVDGLPDCGTCW